ncbi:MAG: hypothetical protein QM704_08580 [Anaeromyxobacteraceae bacterium]
MARAGGLDLPSCVSCRGLAEVLKAPRSELTSYLQHVGRALRYPVKPASMLAIFGCALVMLMVSFVPLIGGFAAFGIRWSFLLAIIRQASRGADEFQAPEAADPWDGILAPGARGLMALAILWVPAIFRAGSLLASGRVESAADLYGDPILWLLLLASALYAPAAVLVAAFGTSIGMLNPLHVLGTAYRFGRDYLYAVGAVLLVFFASYVFEAVVPSAFGSIFLVSALLRETAELVPSAFAAYLLGLLVFVRGDAIELGPASDHLVPVLGDAVPRGAAPPDLATVPVRPDRPEPIALEPEPAPGPADEIARLVAASDLAGAARLFEAHRRTPLVLTPAVLFEVGRGASQAGAHAVAAEALHRAARSEDPAVAPAAMLVLARILERRLSRPADAQRLYLHLVRHHGDTDAGRQAKAALGVGAPGG